MNLTTEQLNILNHVVENGQAWANHVETTFPEKSEAMMLAKVAKYRQSYLDAQGGDYQTRKQKEDAYWQEMEERRTNVSYAVKRQREYPSVEELVVALYDTDDKAAIEKRRADVKKKFPKPE